MDINDKLKSIKKANSQESWMINRLDREFVFYWNGEKKTIPPNKSVSYPRYLLDHAAKKLANEMMNDDKVGYRSPEIVQKYLDKIIL